MVEKGILKNKRKGRESSKDMGQARGCSKSTATSRYKSAEVIPMDSEDEGTDLPPKGPSPTPSSVQDTPWPTCDYCAIKGLVCSPGPEEEDEVLAECRPKGLSQVDQAWTIGVLPTCEVYGIETTVSSTPPSQEIAVGQAASRGWSIQTTPRNVVIPLPSRSFAQSSIPPARQSMQPDDSLSPLPVSKDKEIATLQAQVWILEQKVADWMRNTQALTTVVKALHRQVITMQVPLPPLPNIGLRVPITNTPSHHTPSTLPRTSVTPIAPQASLPRIPWPSPMAVIPPPPVAILPAIPRSLASATCIPSGEAALACIQPPSPESPRSLAPPITVLSPATTPSSGPDIVTTPEVDTRQPSPAAVAAAQPDINMPVDAGPAPSALSPMEDVQASPNITIIDVDAVVDIDATPTLVADGTVTAAEAKGNPDPSTAPALHSPQWPAAALQALTAKYEDKEDMEVDD
ncbi:hypothetical protein BDN67DRAFT_985883 [Paxillus ammoniavirescens]|nr:hypothetical protein BDN67DRAFT_985883 [Paxillus ammoniavirescens]